MTRDRVAIAHDYISQRGGAEKVVLAMMRAFPDATVTTSLFSARSTYPEFDARRIRTTWLNRVPGLARFHRLALPLLAPVISRTSIDAECVLASSSGWAHGFRTTGPTVVYCYSPARWLYQGDAYLGVSRFSVKRIGLSLVSRPLRRWDRRKATGATRYLAISSVVQQRIRDAYGIHADVVPAPHSMDPSLPQEPVDLGPVIDPNAGFSLCVSRLLPYKNVDIVVGAHAKTGFPLVVVGSGPEERNLKAISGPSTVFLKHLPDAQLRWLYSRCEHIVSASFEDFGLTPLEAACFGKPSVVLKWGGFLDTVVEGKTGTFFDAPEAEALAEAVRLSLNRNWDTETLRAHAAKYSEAAFAAKIQKIVAAEITRSVTGDN